MIRNFKYVLIAASFNLAAQTACAMPWIRAESEHFVIYSHNSAQQTRAYTGMLEKFSLVTGELYNQLSDTVLPTYDKTRFNYMATVSEFRIVRPELHGNAFNPYLPCREGVQYFSTGDGQNNNDLYGQGTLDPQIDLNVAYMFLGYNSHILHERFSKLPDWVSHGLNWYFMTAVFMDDEVVIGKPPPNIAMSIRRDRIEMLLHDKHIIPYSDRIADKPTPPDMEDMAALEDWVMVSYLMATPERRKQFAEYLHLVNEGTASRIAYDKAINVDPASYAEILKTYSKQGVPTLGYKISPLPEASVTVTALPDYPVLVPVPMIDAALQTCPDQKDGIKLLDSMRKVATRFPDDVITQMALARAEVYFGKPEAAKDYLNSQLEANPENFEAQFLMGRLYLALAEDGQPEARKQNYIQARTALGKAYKLNPASAPTLYLYARAFADQPNYPDTNTMNALLLAQDYSGSNYDVYEAELHVRQGDYTKAQEIIDRLLTIPVKKPNKDKLDTLIAIRDSLATKKEKVECLQLFAYYDKIEN